MVGVRFYTVREVNLTLSCEESESEEFEEEESDSDFLTMWEI